jgi:glyoxylase-like metal-dependent hydrolase (beta-lactamase superfamily II)
VALVGRSPQVRGPVVTSLDAPTDAPDNVWHQEIGQLRVVTIMTGAPWRENCHLVTDIESGDSLLLDPGALPDEILALTRRFDATIRAVALTHGHHDHVGAVADVCRTLGLPCYIHAGDVRLARQAPLWAFRFSGRKIEVPAPLEPLDPSAREIGGLPLRVLETPGHTQGGVCFIFDGVAVTGDTLLYRHVGRTDLPGGNLERLKESVGVLLANLSDSTVLLAGHGRPWTAGEARAWWDEASENPSVLDEHRDLS